jgi:hypothetical protein
MSMFRILLTILIFLISAIPLNIAVKFLGGKTNLIKTALISLIAGIVVGFIQDKFRVYGSIIAFIILIWIYHESFRLKWLKAIIAWLLQFVIIAIFYFILILLGIALILF